MSNTNEQVYTILIEKVLGQGASEEEFKSLEQAILQDKEVRDLYMDLARQHSHLQQTAAAGLVTPLSEPELLNNRSASNTQKPKNLILYRLGIAAASIAAVIALGFALTNSPSKPSFTPYGTLTKSSSAQWGGCSVPTVLNAKLGAGDLELLQGTAEVQLSSGVTVRLEAPVRFEIIDDMKTYIHYGTAVADVPDGAEGFRMDAPDAEVTDYGTVFAVSVNETGNSVVDVIEGEVEVFKPSSQQRTRLTDEKTSWEMPRSPNFSEDTPLFLPLSEGEGRFASIIANNDKEHLHKNLLLVKHPIGPAHLYTRKAYLRFDLSKADLTKCSALSLSLSQVQSPFGLASYVSDCKFSVHMLNEETPWPSKMLWETAPATNLEDVPNALHRNQIKTVGTFIIPEGQQKGQVEVKLDQLEASELRGRRFLTLILSRDTAELSSLGLAHAFAGKDRRTSQEPRLILHKH